MTDKLKDFVRCIGYMLGWVYLIKKVQRIKTKVSVVLCIANPGSVGGTELQVQIISDALKARYGDCLILVCGKIEAGKSNLFLKRLSVPFLTLGNIGLIRYDLHPFLKKQTANALRAVIGNSKICHFFNPKSTALVPVVKSLGLTPIYMETGMPALNNWYRILHSTLSQCSFVTSVSKTGLNHLETLFGYRGESTVIPSMFNPPTNKFISRDPIENRFDIVYFGRMTQDKGIDLLIRSFSDIITELPYATLSLIGAGESLSQLKTLVELLNLSTRVQFTNWLTGEALFSRLIDMDLFCLPSFTEGLPSSILEAMSIGLPTLATNVGGIPEIIENNESGIVISAGDQKALSEALLKIGKNPSLRSKLGGKALLKWEKTGTNEVVLEQLFSVYQTILKDSQSLLQTKF